MSDQALNHALNSPFAVVVLLGLILTFLAISLDKFTYFFKTVTKKTPMDKMSKSYDLMVTTVESVSKHMDENNKVLSSLHNLMQRHEEMAAMRHEQLLRELDRK